MTCCYCGARSLIGLRAARHDLVCHGCGAPILEIDLLAAPGPARPRQRGESRGPKPAIPHPAERPRARLDKDRPVRRRKGRRRSLWSRAAEAFDDLDDLFDLFD